MHDEEQDSRRRLIGTAELANKLGCHLMSIPRLRKRPGFPQPIKPFGKNVWVEEEVDAYIENLMAANTAKVVAT
jgi:predicted DNA-binding transcriptional regulator AlpA